MEDYGISLLCGCTLLMQQIICFRLFIVWSVGSAIWASAEKKEIPVWYQRVSAVLAILVFVSTLLTKQHVLVDVAGGILLAELCFCIGRNTTLYKIYERFGSRIEKKILKSTEG